MVPGTQVAATSITGRVRRFVRTPEAKAHLLPLRSLMVVNIGHAAKDGTFLRNPRLAFDEAASLV